MSLKKRFKNLQESIYSHSHLVRGHAVVIVNIISIVLTALYIYLRIGYVNDMVPFWFTELWGNSMLAPKIYLFLLPSTAAVLLMTGTLLELLLRRYFVRYLREVILTFISFVNIMMLYSSVHIIFAASSPFPPLLDPLTFSLLIPFLTALVVTLVGVPAFIKFAQDYDIITNPRLHQHPGMLLQNPSARGGGSFYAFIFIILAILFVGLPAKLLGFYLAILMVGILGFVDDYQNTHPKSIFRPLENPLLRLILLFAAVAVLIMSGVTITTVSNPYGGIFEFSQLPISLNANSIQLIIYFVTALWIVWVLNLMSWSNGIDGQYSGIVGIASIFICLLALRFTPLVLLHKQVAIMAAISGGIAFGIARYSWYPSSIMWGFGATSAALVIAVLSILINTKILISILILLIPFLDATVTFIRRIMQKKSPLKGDRGHLHHLLLARGWSIPQIARFYWIATLISGLIGYFGSDKYLIQTVLIAGGLVAFVIVLINLKSSEKRV